MKITIPFFIFLSFGALLTPRHAEATPVVESSIPAGIDWFVHIDAEKLYASRAGSAFKSEFQEIVAEQAQGQLPLDPVLIADGIKGLTVFGTMPDFTAEEFVPDAVVVLEGTPDLIQVFKGMVSGLQIEQPEAIVPVENDPNGILSLMNGEIYGSFVGENQIVVSKALPGLQNFFSVAKGEASHINLANRFAIYGGEGAAGIFFGAFVEGLDEFDELPVQARILQLTQSVSLQLGEQGDYLNLLASLMTADAQTAAQVSEVLKGLIAVAALTHNGNPEIGTLINTADVVLKDQTVTLNISYPVESAVQWATVLAEKARADMAAAAAAEAAAAAAAEAAEAAEAAAEAAEAAAAAAEAEAEAADTEEKEPVTAG